MDRHAKIIYLAGLPDWTYAQIGEAVGISGTGVRDWLKRHRPDLFDRRRRGRTVECATCAATIPHWMKYCSRACYYEARKSGFASADTIRRRAYDLGAAGLKWREVAEGLRLSDAVAAIKEAGAYARTHGKKWPLKRS